MKARKALSFLAATAAGFSLLAASPATAYAAKPGGSTAQPCYTDSAGVKVCPYADDEPGEYTENFYSGDWGSAGGGGVIVIGDTSTRFWDSHMVYKLDQEPADAGAHDVVLEDKRVVDAKEYSLNLGTLASAINKVTALNVTVGSCDAFPEANCISVVDFTSYSTNSSVGGYMSPTSLTARKMAFNGRFMSGKSGTKILLHEGGHAFGLSHKHSSDGVMSYHLRDSGYSDDEIAALQLAYGAKEKGGGKKITGPASATASPVS